MKVASLRKKLSTAESGFQVVVSAPGGTRHYPITGIEYDKWNIRLIVGLPVDDKNPHPHPVRKAVTPRPANARNTSLPIPGDPCFTLSFPEGRDYAVDVFSSDDGRQHHIDIDIEAIDPADHEDDLSNFAGMDGHQPADETNN